MTDRQKRAFDQHWKRYGLSVDAPLSLPKSPVFLEIGFGMGHSLCEMAKANPESLYIGVEVHKPGVGALLDACASGEIANVRVYNDDANIVLEKAIPDHSLNGIYIFFPDPWPKKRHHKRRLIQASFVNHLIPKLKPGGFIHLATDWESYAQQMMEVLSEFKVLKNHYGEGEFVPETLRPTTKFEQRGKRLGHGVWDLLFTIP